MLRRNPPENSRGVSRGRGGLGGSHPTARTMSVPSDVFDFSICCKISQALWYTVHFLVKGCDSLGVTSQRNTRTDLGLKLFHELLKNGINYDNLFLLMSPGKLPRKKVNEFSEKKEDSWQKSYKIKCILLLLLVVVFSPWASLGRNQSPVRRPVWLWYTASWVSS